jgi:molybdate transport system substrate-binding protein
MMSVASTALAETVRAAVAISLKEAIVAVQSDFEKSTGDTLELSFGASGQLAAQIKNGAPIDLFISAAQKQVDELVTSGHVERDSTRIVAGNRLVLIAPADAKSAPASFEALAKTDDARIAIGEPASVPAGDYATQVFATLKLTDALAGRLVFGTNVRQVLAYVERGEVSAGVVYATDALQSGEKVKVMATADQRWHKPIIYPAAVIKTSKSADAAKRFLDYLQTPIAQAALTSRGFSVPSEPATRPAK